MATIRSTIELTDKMSKTLSNIERNVNSLKTTLQSVTKDSQSSIDNVTWDNFLKGAETAGEKMVSIGKKMSVAISGPLLLLGKKMYGTATDYESAFAGVRKTTDATEEEFQGLYEGLLQIAEANPTGFVDAAGIMEMAGQLGVAKDELLGFTQAYIGLQESTNVSGEQGAADLARFLNVTEKTTSNVGKVGGVIVALGNNFATTEDEILQMATRMGATADLAGFSAAEILAFSAALSSVGIRAEAGGSAAGKLMKKMQLAAEVGGTAAERLSATGRSFDSALDFSHWLDIAKKADLVDLADDLGMTTDAVKDLGKAWLAMEQFSDVMGVDTAGFLKGWKEGPAQAMLGFFQGLGNLDPEKGNSVLAQLAEMDLTEIRLSNLVAAMAGNSDLFQQALQLAYAQYGMEEDANAMAEEVAKRYSTQESQNAMLGNKLENTMADFGANLVSAVQPALDKVNELLTAFNSLSEADQDKVITAFMVFAAGGPVVTAVGGTVEAVGKIGKALTSVTRKVSGLTGTGGLSALLSNPVTWGVAAGIGITAFVALLDEIPTKFEKLAAGVKDIPITVDQGTYNETLDKIAEVRAALDGLKPGETNQEYENTAAAVAYGYGTTDMYGAAMTYEAAKTSAAIGQVASDYAEKMAAAQEKIITAAAAGDKAGASAAKAEFDGLRTALDAEIASMKAEYTAKLSDLFGGMASQYPEAAEALQKAAAGYDLTVGIDRLENFDYSAYGDIQAGMEAHQKLLGDIMKNAWDAGYLKDAGYESFESMMSDSYFNPANWLDVIGDMAGQDLSSAIQAVSDNPILATWLQNMINDPGIAENLDVTTLSGALEGIFKALDFKAALEQAGSSPNDFGLYVSQGLSQGITDNASLATTAATALGTGTINNIKTALGVNSPSTYTIAAGLALDQGLVIGINNGSGMVVAAAKAMASRVLSAMKESMGIHSPSAETYWQGEMLIAGYNNAISDGEKTLQRTVVGMNEGVSDTWNDSVWDMIGGFASTEAQALRDQMNNVEDGIKISDADIKNIRQLAEREAINQFTTAEVRVEMNNTNTISSDMDIDGIIMQLEDRVSERLEAVAEGVYT